MLETKQFMAEVKAKYIAHEIIMGNRSDYDFNRILIASDNKENKANCLHNINRDNTHDYAHYLVEMGYLNVFNKDKKVAQKLYTWYQSQLSRAFKLGYIQLFCILYARTLPIFEKYGKIDVIDRHFFDVIMDNYKENKNKARYCAGTYSYIALAEYAEIIYKIIEEWIVSPTKERTVRTRPEFSEWLENEKNFITDLYLLKSTEDGSLWYPGCNHEVAKMKFERDKGLMIIAITKALLELKNNTAS